MGYIHSVIATTVAISTTEKGMRKYSEYKRGAGYDFETWMEFVDGCLAERALGMTSMDIPDMPWYDWYYYSKLTPLGAAKEAIKTMKDPRTSWW